MVKIRRSESDVVVDLKGFAISYEFLSHHTSSRNFQQARETPLEWLPLCSGQITQPVSQGRRFNPQLLQSVGLDYKLWLLSPYDLSCWWGVKHKHTPTHIYDFTKISLAVSYGQ